MEVDLYNQKFEIIGKTELPNSIFSAQWRPDIVHQVLIAQQANRRKPIAHAKTRGEVRGGGRKPHRQKGTGRARHGSIRSPIWKGGGVTFGPTKERNFSKKVNKKVKRLALFSAISKKLSDNELKVIDKIEIKEPKTKLMASTLLNIIPKKKNSGLLIIPKANPQISRAIRNLDFADLIIANSLNLENILKYKNILILQDSINILKEIYKLGE
jgi:large subunit ribosomal protein L4